MERKRLLLPGFISLELCEVFPNSRRGQNFVNSCVCIATTSRAIAAGFIFLSSKELVFIHKSCGVVGYRPHVFSTTLPHLVATNSAALIMPFITLRERVKEAVEEFFGCEFELFVEFTGLISWTSGASIGWHSDDNRDYLRQRHFSAVCYLNTYEQDFHGGLFHFQDGQPATVIPTLGTVLIYSADEKNIHCVDEVMDGERITMALWFTRDPAHDEDKKLIDQLINVMPLASQLSQEKEGLEENADGGLMTTNVLSQSAPRDAILRDSFAPVPASTNMYWVGEREMQSKAGHNVGSEVADEAISLNANQGFDVRVKRLASLGFHCVGHLDDPDSILGKPLKLNYGHQQIAYEFANVLHALQVVEFHVWRTCTPALCSSSVYSTSQQTVQDLKSDEPHKFKSQKPPRTSMIREPRHPQTCVLHADINAAVAKPWEDYMCALNRDLLQMMPDWQNTGSLFLR